MYKQHFLLLLYNKDVICVIDETGTPICKSVEHKHKKKVNINVNVPVYDPYIPRKNGVFYNCSSVLCDKFELYSLTQITDPDLNLKICFDKNGQKAYKCEAFRYHYLKNIDKLLFLTTYIQNRKFYLVDCLVYADGSRVCHPQDEEDSLDAHTKLIHFGNIAKPDENNVLAQEDFLCEEDAIKYINCDLNSLVPFIHGLEDSTKIKIAGKVLLKTGTFVVELKPNCLNSWCGLTGTVVPTRRQYSHRPPGGKTFKCFYAKGQEICNEIYPVNANFNNPPIRIGK